MLSGLWRVCAAASAVYLSMHVLRTSSGFRRADLWEELSQLLVGCYSCWCSLSVLLFKLPVSGCIPVEESYAGLAG